jgi:copper homeostasis protein
MKFELCTDSVEGAVIAGQYGFSSIELCTALSVGGLTPGYGLIQECVANSAAEVHVMIRPCEGGFQVSNADLRLMHMEIQAAKKAGATGVVFGILDSENKISDRNHELVELAKGIGMKATFHRAFDFVPDFRKAAEKVVAFGFDRLLTSGLQDSAENGIQVIAEISRKYGDRIQVIAGSGVSAGNALKFSVAGINYLHFTARKPGGEIVSKGMGQHMLTDTGKIEQIINLPYDGVN